MTNGDGGAVLVAGDIDLGIEFVRQRLHNARPKARLGVGRALMGLADAVVGNRQRPARPAGVIGDNNPPVCLGLRETRASGR